MNLVQVAVAALALSALGTTTAQPAPQLVVERAQPKQHWTSATEAPLYASSGEAGRIDLWDAHNGTLLRTVMLPQMQPAPEAERSAPPIVLSNDGRVAATVVRGRIALISARDGKIAELPAALAERLRPVTFSPDGRTLAVEVRPTPDPNSLQTGHGSIALVSIARGVAVPIPNAETDAAYSPDGRFVATLTPARDRLLVFDVRRRRLRSLSDGSGVYGPLAYSSDGTLVASLGDDPSIPPNGKGVYEPNATDHDLVVKVWDMRRGRLAARLPWKTVSNRFDLDEQGPGKFAFGDAHLLAVDAAQQTVLYNMDSLTVAGRLQHGVRAYYDDDDRAVTPYRVGGTLGFITENAQDLAFTHWSGGANKSVATIPFPAQVGNIAIDRLGGALGVDGISRDEGGAARRDAAYVLSLATLQWTTIPARQSHAKPIFFLNDGRIAVPSLCSVLYVDARAGGVARHVVPGGLCAYPFPEFALSSDGQTVFLGTADGLLSPPNAVPETITLQAYDIATGRRRYAAPGTTSLPLACAPKGTNCAFERRTTTANLGHQHDPVTLAVMDSTTGKLVSTFVLHTLIGGAAFIDSGRQLIIRETAYTNVETDTIDVIDPLRGTLARQFHCPEGDIAFAPSAALFSVTNSDATTIFNSSGTIVSTIPNTIAGQSDNITFFPSGSKLAVVEPDGTIAVRATASGRLLTTFAFFSHHDTLDWLAYTPDGYYAGTPFAMTTVRWRIGDQTLPGAAFARRFHRPDLIVAAFRNDLGEASR